MRADGGSQAGNGNRKKTIILAILIGLAVICVGVIGLLFVQSKMQEKSYSESIQSAEKYLAQNNYEDAIIAYKKAITANPEEAEGYLALADVYTEQENGDEAKAILEKGYARTKSPKIKNMLDNLQTLVAVGGQTVEPKNTLATYDLATASVGITWNMSLIQKFEDFTFDNFKSEFGSTTKTSMDSDGYLEVVHSSLGATCFYKNTTDNKGIVDVSRKKPEKTGMPEKISLDSIAQLFRNFEGGVTLEKLQIMSGSTLTPKTEDGKTLIEIPVGTCLVRVETDKDGNIVSANAWNEIFLLNANQEDTKMGHLSGTVVNAVTAEGVVGATLQFNPTDTKLEVVNAVTTANGAFSVDLEPDTYQILITADGYVEEWFEFVVEEDQSYSGETFTISPSLTAGSARIVLEWGAEPRDLDSYLTGDTDSGVHVTTSFSNRTCSSNGTTLADLDVDNTGGYGPETTTIYDLNGSYTFWVHDFTRSGNMRNSGATVKVYLEGQEPRTITINPSSSVDNIWLVFTLDHGQLKVLDEARDHIDY